MTQKSDALDLECSVFASNDPYEIAISLKKSSEKAPRRKSNPFRSAMSILTSTSIGPEEILSARKRRTIEAAKHPGRVRYATSAVEQGAGAA